MTFNPQPRKPKPVRESRIEASGKARVAAAGGRSLKMTGLPGIPDQIELYGAAPLALYLDIDLSTAVTALSKAIVFTEYKAPGKHPEPHQQREHARLRAAGFTVNVIDHET